MKYTCAEAAKILRRLNEEHDAIESREGRTSVFIAAIEEDIESVRPEYQYAETQARLAELEKQVRAVKHAINLFNQTTQVPGFNMTVDQMLVYIPQLSEKKARLQTMASRLPKERVNSYGSSARTIVEYKYANYNIADAEADLSAVTDELARAQTALDVVNNTMKLELDL